MSLEINKESWYNLFPGVVTGRENYQLVHYETGGRAKFGLYSHQSNLIEVTEFALT